MNPILKKLGFKNQTPILILNIPNEYKEILEDIDAKIHFEIKGTYDFIQVFALHLSDVVSQGELLVKAVNDNGYLWICYPKGTSKKYKSDINRTKAWDVFAPYEFEPVSQVSIDENWTAMRFRHVDHIKKMTRKTAATEKGKLRIQERTE